MSWGLEENRATGLRRPGVLDRGKTRDAVPHEGFLVILSLYVSGITGAQKVEVHALGHVNLLAFYHMLRCECLADYPFAVWSFIVFVYVNGRRAPRFTDTDRVFQNR